VVVALINYFLVVDSWLGLAGFGRPPAGPLFSMQHIPSQAAREQGLNITLPGSLPLLSAGYLRG